MFYAGLFCGWVVVMSSLAGCVSPLEQLQGQAKLRETIRQDFSPAAEEKRDAVADQLSAEDNSPVIDETSTLGASLRYAAETNPQLEAAWQRWQAALERVPQVTTLPDPRVSYGYFLNEIETRVGPQQHRFGLSQTLPWFGKLELEGDVVAEAADAVFERFQAARFSLFQQVHKTFAELFYLRSAIELTKENLDILQQFERIVRARYRVAAPPETGTTHSDLVRIQLELGRLEDRVSQLRQLRPTLVAQFNAALNRAPDAGAPWPTDLVLPKLTLDEDQLRRLLRERNPQLLALTAEMREHRVAAKLARKSVYPDVTVSMDYIVTGEAVDTSINESGDDAVIAGFSLNLPIRREKYDAAVRESLRRRLATAAERKATENTLLADLEQAIFDYRDAQRRIDLYRNTLIPKAKETLNASLQAYQAATVPFLDLLDSERTLLELQLNQQRAVADVSVAMATIEMLTGEALGEEIDS